MNEENPEKQSEIRASTYIQIYTSYEYIVIKKRFDIVIIRKDNWYEQMRLKWLTKGEYT